MRQSDEQTPPVVDQCHGTSRQLTTMQVVCGVAAPTPLVLEFIEGVLSIRLISVELAKAENLVVGVGDENGVLVTGDLLPPFSVLISNERQPPETSAGAAARRLTRRVGAARSRS